MAAAVATPSHVPNTVMVCDDLKVNRLVLGRMFRKLGFNVIEAENGRDCLAQLEREHTAILCVVLDLIMPVLDGWETCQQLRVKQQQQHWHHFPLFACTAEELGTSVTQLCAAVGFDECLGKPVSLAFLCQLLKKHIPSFEHALLSTPPSSTTDPDAWDAQLHARARQLLREASALNTQQQQQQQQSDLAAVSNPLRRSVDSPTRAGAAYYYQAQQAMAQRRCSSEQLRL